MVTQAPRDPRGPKAGRKPQFCSVNLRKLGRASWTNYGIFLLEVTPVIPTINSLARNDQDPHTHPQRD